MEKAYKKMTSHGSISIPVAMRRNLGIEAKDPMVVEEQGGNIIISPYTPRCVLWNDRENRDDRWKRNMSGMCKKSL